MAKPQPRERVVCLARRVDGRECWKRANWFVSTPIEKRFLCGVHVRPFFDYCKYPITDQVLQAMADFYPVPPEHER